MERVALIFDLDGTLWDSSSQVAESWSEVGRKYFGPSFSITAPEVRAQMGLMMEEIQKNIARSSPDYQKGLLWAKESFDYEIEYLRAHPGEKFPDEEQTLLELKNRGYILLIMSNCQKGYIEDYLASLKTPGLFSGHLCYGDTLLPKHGSIARLMKDFRIDRAAYVGDTASDEKQTRLAGLKFIHASYGFGSASSPDATLKRFSDMLEAAREVLPMK
ncbi:MAG TPA: HAD family hydrolase [Firmicutes bacterium]|mgnify:FL=1|nr:HAD family hydrolase [Bacillota bacterium]